MADGHGQRPPWTPDLYTFELRCGHLGKGNFLDRFNGAPACTRECGKVKVCKDSAHTCHDPCGHKGPCSPCRGGACDPAHVDLIIFQTIIGQEVVVVKEGEKSKEELIELAKEAGTCVIMLEADSSFPSGPLEGFPGTLY